MERIPTGIPGLDKLIQGGFIPGSVIMITGSTGTGKTIFGCQFLWAGLQKGEPGIYLTLEEPPEDIKQDAQQFGWDFSKYEKKGIFKLVYMDPVRLGSATVDIANLVRRFKAKRLVIDSISLIGLAIKDPSLIRRRIYNLISALKKTGCTTLLISEIPEGSDALSKYGVEEYVVDGVIVMKYWEIASENFGSIEIRKMRKTAHLKGHYPTFLGKSGLKVGSEALTPLK